MFVCKVDEMMTIRMLKASEAKDFFQITEASRQSLEKWIPGIQHTQTHEDALNLILHAFELYANERGLNTGIFLEDELIGVISVNEFDWRKRVGYIGYWLSETHRGKGLMTKATKGFIHCLFKKYPLNKVEIHVARENIKSRAIPERLGFKKERIIKDAEWLKDHYVDHIIYGLFRKDWYQRSET